MCSSDLGCAWRRAERTGQTGSPTLQKKRLMSKIKNQSGLREPRTLEHGCMRQRPTRGLHRTQTPFHQRSYDVQYGHPGVSQSQHRMMSDVGTSKLGGITAASSLLLETIQTLLPNHFGIWIAAKPAAVKRTHKLSGGWESSSTYLKQHRGQGQLKSTRPPRMQ